MPNQQQYKMKVRSTFFIPQATLNFHAYGPISKYDIKRELELFIEDSYLAGLREVLIITGQGYNSPNGPIVRPLVSKLLKQNKMVASYSIADSSNGGEGALEVILACE